MKQTKSLELYKRAIKVIPGGAQTISKYYGRYIKGVAPAFITYGHNAYVYDVDGNSYIDFTGALGPVILGYNHYTSNINAELRSSPSLPLPHPVEVELAEKLVEIIPCAEMVRFFKTGSGATSAAIRLAKAVTGREWVVCSGYHGWHDWYACTLPPPKCKGSLGRTRTYKIGYGELNALEFWFKYTPTACFILEPMNRECPEKANSEYLMEVKKLCNKYGVILIFDEVIMGFRHTLAGGQEYYGVTPDLATYAKAMANGWPIAALVGRREIMKEIKDLQISSTYFGDPIPMKVALNVINFMEKNDVIYYLNTRGDNLIAEIENLLDEFKLSIKISGFGPWSKFVFWKADLDPHYLFLQEITKRGILYTTEHLMMFAHDEIIIEKVLNIYREVFKILADRWEDAGKLLQGRAEDQFYGG